MRTAVNPPNPFHKVHIEYEDAPPLTLHVSEERAKTILTKNDSPDLQFRYSMNPYRGCHHGCLYCYARASHHYLGLGAGTDFERRIIAKVNAPELLAREIEKPSWKGDVIVVSGNTDCYQPLERKYRLTRRLLDVCCRARNPVAIITKSTLVADDIDLFRRFVDSGTQVSVTISVNTTDDSVARAIEPYAPAPSARFRVLEMLARAGLRTGVSLAPCIPGLTDTEIPAVLERAAAVGASYAFITLLRLTEPVAQVFWEGVENALPERVDKISGKLARLRAGQPFPSDFSTRMVGTGAEWDAIQWLFDSTCLRLGLCQDERFLQADRPQKDVSHKPEQLRLFPE